MRSHSLITRIEAGFPDSVQLNVVARVLSLQVKKTPAAHLDTSMRFASVRAD
jgi:hypothetical protein